MSGSLEVRVAALERHIERLERRLRGGVSFARTTMPPVDTGTVQTVQSRLDALSVRNDLPILFHYGFSSAMPVGGDKLVMHGYGERSSAIAVATGHQQYRYKGLQTGEVVLHDNGGSVVKLAVGGNITVTSTNSVTVISPTVFFKAASGGNTNVAIVGNLGISGTLDVSGNITGSSEITGRHGTPGSVSLTQHRHGTGTAVAGTSVPTPGT
jgi:phage gp45-like